MKKLRMIIELEYNDVQMHGEQPDALNWFIADVLGASRDSEFGLILHSNLIGAEVGTVQLISILPDRLPEPNALLRG